MESDRTLPLSSCAKEKKSIPVRDEEIPADAIATTTSHRLPAYHLAEHGIQWLGNDISLDDDKTPNGWKISYRLTPGPLFDLH